MVYCIPALWRQFPEEQRVTSPIAVNPTDIQNGPGYVVAGQIDFSATAELIAVPVVASMRH